MQLSDFTQEEQAVIAFFFKKDIPHNTFLDRDILLQIEEAVNDNCVKHVLSTLKKIRSVTSTKNNSL